MLEVFNPTGATGVTTPFASRLNTLDRDFTRDSLDPTVAGYNPAPWSTLTNLAGWTAKGPLPATPSLANEFGTTLSAPLSNFTPASCAAVGGRYDNTFTCAYNYVSYYNLVEENNIYRGYGQLNAEINASTNAHVEASYAKVSSPQIFGSPAGRSPDPVCIDASKQGRYN